MKPTLSNQNWAECKICLILELTNPAIMGIMATVHMTQSEVTQEFAAVLKQLHLGVEVVVEQDHRPVAVIRLPARYAG